MTVVVINPGTGPVREATVAQAEANIKVYAQDIAKKHGLVVLATRREESSDTGDGRYVFLLDCEKEGRKWTLEIQMPGWPLEKVRYLGTPDQNIWDFPRLYVDGSSWVWKFAMDVTLPE